MNSAAAAAETLSDALNLARQRVRHSGARVTDARVRVLAVLIAAESTLSHQDVQEALVDQGSSIDRVTVYRVLEWLNEAGLAHRVSGDDRVYRFGAASPATLAAHGHFQCSRCQKVFCMDAIRDLQDAVRAVLPPGFAGETVELNVKGVCSHCA